MPRNAPPAFHILAKPTGAICNLDCKYCFFLSKEMLYPDSRFRMAEELLETYLRQLLESQQAPEVAIAWQGGEPTLMGLDFFRRSVDLVDRLKRPGQQIQHTIQTNGTKLDDDWCVFFKKNAVLVGLSIDGPRAMHDAYRVDKGGNGTFDDVMSAWNLLRRHEVDVNILCTVHAANQDHPLEVYHFFRDTLGAGFIQFIPIVERVTAAMLPVANEGWGERPGGGRPLYTLEGHQVTERSVRAEPYGKFLIAIFDEWVRRDVGSVYVQHFDSALANWVGVPGAVCIFAETCGQALALEHNGDLYSCDHFVEPAYKLGNIKETHMIEMIASPQQIKFGLDKRDTLPRYCRVHQHARRRAGPQLPVRRLQGFLQSHRPSDEDDGGTAATGALRGRGDGNPRGGGEGSVREGRPQRSLPMRQRQEAQALPRKFTSRMND